MVRIESFLAARLFLSPQWVGDQLYFISNLSGRLSLYRMPEAGGVPQPLLPPDIALFTPELIGGDPFRVFPALGNIAVMIDDHGNEEYAPYTVPIDGGFPEALLPEVFAGQRSHMSYSSGIGQFAVFDCESLSESINTTYLVRLDSGMVQQIARSTHGQGAAGVSAAGDKIAVVEGYTVGDDILKVWTKESGLKPLFGTPLEERDDGAQPPLTGFGAAAFTQAGDAILIRTALFDDHYGIGRIALNAPDRIEPITITGLRHTGMGELDAIHPLKDSRYSLTYNIDGAAWLYEARYDDPARTLTVDAVVAGQGTSASGVLAGEDYDSAANRYAFAFSTATSPTQLYTSDHGSLRQRTNERVLGIPADQLAQGEDASFTA
ncbi:MAG TPA: hypothetical protein VER79_10045, partial [Candidatus Limnocylindrales bacterium]|nr:hypothetical protein [Candidatus Limnocylindrales bacterium]